MTRARSIVLPLLAALLAGCGGVPEATKTEDAAACTSVVTGTYQPAALYEGRAPAMIFKKERGEYRVMYGKVLSVTDAGIMFDGDKEGPFHDPDPKLYPADKIECALDSARNVVYGTLPSAKARTWDLEITWRRVEDTTQSTRFVLEAGKPFSYCMPAGTYEAKKIQFLHGEDIAEGVLLPLLTLSVAKNATNAVGEIRLDRDSADAPGVCVIPFKMVKTGSTGWGMMFGAIGGLVEGLTTDYGVRGGHRFAIRTDSLGSGTAGLPVRAAVTRFAPNPLVPGNPSK